MTDFKEIATQHTRSSIEKLQAENQQLRQEKAALLEVLGGVIEEQKFIIWLKCNHYYCAYCQASAIGPMSIEHHEDCPITKARRAIAAAGGEEADDEERI